MKRFYCYYIWIFFEVIYCLLISCEMQFNTFVRGTIVQVLTVLVIGRIVGSTNCALFVGNR